MAGPADAHGGLGLNAGSVRHKGFIAEWRSEKSRVCECRRKSLVSIAGAQHFTPSPEVVAKLPLADRNEVTVGPQPGVLGCGRPAILLRFLDQASAHGIQFHLRQCFPAVLLIHGARIEARLPEMAGATMQDVEVAGVIAMRPAECACERIRRVWFRDHVHMIVHESITQISRVYRAACSKSELRYT